MIALQTILWFFALFFSQAQAFQPPHPDWKDWENVHDYRKRLNITFNYKPRHISPEICRYMTEEECRHEDHASKAAKERRRLNPAFGKFVVTVLLMRFSDHEHLALPPKEYFEELFNADTKSDTNPVGSIKEYLKYNSMTQYNVDFSVVDWMTTDNTEAHYSFGQSGLVSNVQLQEMFVPLLEQLDAIDGSRWWDFDADDDGLLDHLVVIHSGYAAELGEAKPKHNCGPSINHPDNRIWSRGSWDYPGSGAWRSSDGNFELGGFTVASAFNFPLCGGQWAKMGVITHEYLHGFGLIDLYDGNRDIIGGVAKFDIMATMYGWNRNPDFPGHMSAYSRLDTGWLQPIPITQDGVYAIQPAEISSQVYIISDPYPEGEYLLIENRQPMKWDGDWPYRGIVIFHVDEEAPEQENRGYPGYNNYPTNHYRVAVLQADGEFHIEKNENMGDEGDFWTRGQKLVPGGSYPNSDSYQGGNVVQTGVTIEILTNPGFIMSFKVSGLAGARAPDWFPEHDEDPNPGQVGPTDLNQITRDDDGPHYALTWIFSLLAGLGVVIGLVAVLL